MKTRPETADEKAVASRSRRLGLSTFQKSTDIIRRGLSILLNLDHRGAVGADPLVGDGVGCLIQIPDRLLRAWADGERVTLPPVRDPLLSGLTMRDVVMASNETIMFGDKFLAGDVFSYVVDYDDIAPFCDIPGSKPGDHAAGYAMTGQGTGVLTIAEKFFNVQPLPSGAQWW